MVAAVFEGEDGWCGARCMRCRKHGKWRGYLFSLDSICNPLLHVLCADWHKADSLTAITINDTLQLHLIGKRESIEFHHHEREAFKLCIHCRHLLVMSRGHILQKGAHGVLKLSNFLGTSLNFLSKCVHFLSKLRHDAHRWAEACVRTWAEA